MIDEKFSAISFAEKGLNTRQSLELAYDLATEIQKELHSVITERLSQIIGQLNGLGHDLKLYETPVPGDLAYRDDREDGIGYHCKLRIGVDTVISTGYSHFDTEQPSSDPGVDWLKPENWPDA